MARVICSGVNVLQLTKHTYINTHIKYTYAHISMRMVLNTLRTGDADLRF